MSSNPAQIALHSSRNLFVVVRNSTFRTPLYPVQKFTYRRTVYGVRGTTCTKYRHVTPKYCVMSSSRRITCITHLELLRHDAPNIPPAGNIPHVGIPPGVAFPPWRTLSAHVTSTFSPPGVALELTSRLPMSPNTLLQSVVGVFSMTG